MATLKKLGDRSVRIVCDCGEWLHDLTSDENGKLDVESFQTGKKPAAPPATPPATPPAKKRRSMFDPIDGE
jgi:hypothetical protein